MVRLGIAGVGIAFAEHGKNGLDAFLAEDWLGEGPGNDPLDNSEPFLPSALHERNDKKITKKLPLKRGHYCLSGILESRELVRNRIALR